MRWLRGLLREMLDQALGADCPPICHVGAGVSHGLLERLIIRDLAQDSLTRLGINGGRREQWLLDNNHNIPCWQIRIGPTTLVCSLLPGSSIVGRCTWLPQ